MTVRSHVILTSVVVLLVSFFLRMELLSILTALAIYVALQPSKTERAEEERAERAADIAHKHTETYTVELAKAMARKEAELRGLAPDFSQMKYAKSEYPPSKF